MLLQCPTVIDSILGVPSTCTCLHTEQLEEKGVLYFYCVRASDKGRDAGIRRYLVPGIYSTA